LVLRPKSLIVLKFLSKLDLEIRRLKVTLFGKPQVLQDGVKYELIKERFTDIIDSDIRKVIMKFAKELRTIKLQS
jgi:hypothetical protein